MNIWDSDGVPNVTSLNFDLLSWWLESEESNYGGKRLKADGNSNALNCELGATSCDIQVKWTGKYFYCFGLDSQLKP